MIRIGMAPKDRCHFLFVGEKKATKQPTLDLEHASMLFPKGGSRSVTEIQSVQGL
jgi:hypothetical protein